MMNKAAICCMGTLFLAAAVTQAQTITVTSPNGQESWAQSSSRTITWTTNGLPAGQTLQIVLLLNGGRMGDIALDVPPAPGVFTWTVGAYQGGLAAPGAGYAVRVRVPGGGGAVMDESNLPFTIAPPAPAATLRMTVPNGGESWATGSPQVIRWQAANVAGNVRLDLLKGGQVLGGIAQNIPAVNQVYNWNVGLYAGGQAPLGNDYRIGISSMSSALIDQSDAPFSIVLGALVGRLPEVQRVPSLQLPDLVVCLRRNSHIHVPGSGTVTARVKNIGAGASAPARVSLYFGGDGTKYRTVPALAPGQIHSVGRHEYYTLAGKRTVTVAVDDDQKVTEANENNNVVSGILHRTADAFWAEEPFQCTDGSIIPIGQ